MKIQTIWFLAIIMALTFAGLLYVQITYMHNMVSMRNDQFSEGVRRSLYAVSSRLEQDETKHFLEDDLANMDLSGVWPTGNGTIAITNSPSVEVAPATYAGYPATTPLHTTVGMTTPATSPARAEQQQTLRNLYRYQRSVLNEVVLSILSQQGSRPPEVRADSATVASYLREELDNNGLDLPFEFALVNRAGVTRYHSAGYLPEFTRADSGDKGFTQMLFPSSTGAGQSFIRVYFPGKDEYIFSSLRFFVPTFLFTLILIVVFLFTIIVAFRQKKVTEMKTDFINNMTHELKTPISSISLAAQMLNDKTVTKSEAMTAHISKVINDETKRLRFLVEKVLLTSILDRQKAMVRLVKVDVNKLITNVVESFKLNAEREGGKISVTLAAPKAEVMADEMHLTNVVFNLLENAVKYRRKDEPPLISVATADVDDNRRLRITVADNGIGLRRDDLKKIFDRFYRVGTGNRHDVKGFGLGLTYVKTIIGELGGTITAESRGPGSGSQFVITLPLAADESTDK